MKSAAIWMTTNSSQTNNLAGLPTSDLLLSRDWQDALDDGLNAMVVALVIAGVFDPVWHARFLENCMPRASKETSSTF